MTIVSWLKRNVRRASAKVASDLPLFADPPGFPYGHFYSPLVDIAQVTADAARIWRSDAPFLGIDLNEQSHQELLQQVFPGFLKDYDYPDELEETPDLNRFYSQNSQFSWLDPRVLFAMLRHLRPRRIIEVGSGFSSLLTADINNRFLDNSCHFTCIEPYPREFLQKPLAGLNELLVQKVEDVPLDYFASLQAGDVLFIDSSHVSKTGSDVNYLFFEILPRLQPGVYIHIHDIFFPHDYPREWVIDDFRSWNEQYVLRALLMYSSAFRVVFGSYHAFLKYPQLVEAALGLESGHGFAGSSLWIQRQ
ncbi:MAG: class I SAM-dependent methyltransferase [Pseudomonadota bacterium]